ncbi:GNAT family N-acetyltransferase [Lacticaseibacillus jixiensis]|uniref:GNAT family N-acetyltransferase n=1 Tax=Lacticaseibacillus jixiensis TaxID=3231926 RepID=UPI0036F3415A
MTIRPITPADDAALAGIVRSCLQAAGLDQPGTAYYDPELDHLSAYYAAAPDRAYFVATQQAQVIGGIGIGDYDRTLGICEVQKLYLLPSARGQHRGRQLLEYCEQQAKHLGWRQLYLETHTNLPVAIHLYETAGYTRIAQPLHPGPHTVMDHFYVKLLD